MLPTLIHRCPLALAHSLARATAAGGGALGAMLERERAVQTESLAESTRGRASAREVASEWATATGNGKAAAWAAWGAHYRGRGPGVGDLNPKTRKVYFHKCFIELCCALHRLCASSYHPLPTACSAMPFLLQRPALRVTWRMGIRLSTFLPLPNTSHEILCKARIRTHRVVPIPPQTIKLPGLLLCPRPSPHPLSCRCRILRAYNTSPTLLPVTTPLHFCSSSTSTSFSLLVLLVLDRDQTA